jgi:hypothetical protein
MTAAWPAFRIAAATLTDAQLDEKTSSGWTYRQMLGHVAAWHELARRRIGEFRRTGSTEPSGDQGLDALLKALGVESEDRAALLSKWDKPSDYWLKAFAWEGGKLVPKFATDFNAVGRAHIMNFGSKAMHAVAGNAIPGDRRVSQ